MQYFRLSYFSETGKMKRYC